MNAKGPPPIHHRRYSYRTVLIVAIFLPFLFIRAAFLALDAASICPPISCLRRGFGPRFFGASDDASLHEELGEEVRKALAADGGGASGRIDPTVVESAPDSLDGLMAEMRSSPHRHLDIPALVHKTKAMLMKMEKKVQSARLRASIFKYLASIGIPKSMHCLTLMLVEEYSINSLARTSLPPPEYASLLTNSSHLHLVILTDNVLAASVAISSTITSSANPDKLVFHIITNKKTYTAMHTWFALHPVSPAIVEVKGLHQFDWPAHVNAVIMETAEEVHQGSLDHHGYEGVDHDRMRLEGLNPSSFSLLNYLKIHLPELFPKLERVISLDDDVVVQRDLTSLWDFDLNGNVNGAVSIGVAGDCAGGKLSDHLNFSDNLISGLGLEGEGCAWLAGMNVFDLKAWRRTNITQTYHHWLKLNRELGFALFGLGSLPPALIAFDGQVEPIDPKWHLSGLGRRTPKLEVLQSVAVLHFSGPGKPWLETGFPELRLIWQSHLNRSDEFISSCRVLE